jgi:hypothetical protein
LKELISVKFYVLPQPLDVESLVVRDLSCMRMGEYFEFVA